jgi:hypothetical protein
VVRGAFDVARALPLGERCGVVAEEVADDGVKLADGFAPALGCVGDGDGRGRADELLRSADKLPRPANRLTHRADFLHTRANQLSHRANQFPRPESHRSCRSEELRA